MSSAQFDVIVVGGGAAGMTAAIALARGGFRVAVVEAAPFPGAENWSGCVYFCENLAQPEVLGPEGVEALAWERRLIERGIFFTDGRRLAGSMYRDADAFRNWFTVLRPRFTQHLLETARRYGIYLWTETTVESLIRAGRRIVGVATTRGPLYADLVFLAEGDCGLLVTREGFDRFSDPRDQPAFLYCIQQIIELPDDVIEERFRLEQGEGVAYD